MKSLNDMHIKKGEMCIRDRFVSTVPYDDQLDLRNNIIEQFIVKSQNMTKLVYYMFINFINIVL